MHESSTNKLVKLIPRLKIDYYYDDGLAAYYTEDGRAGAQFKAKKVADVSAARERCGLHKYFEYEYETHADTGRNLPSIVNGSMRTTQRHPTGLQRTLCKPGFEITNSLQTMSVCGLHKLSRKSKNGLERA